MSNYKPITLIGFGIAGQLLLSYILDLVPGHNVTIIDPDFVGGDLMRDYSGIHSNTTIGKKIESLAKLPGNWSDTINGLKMRGGSDDTVLLADLVSDMRKSSSRHSASCDQIYDKVQKTIWNQEHKRWFLHLESGSEYTTAIICFCGGMYPRQKDYGIPIIPLSTALDEGRLSRIVEKGNNVIVFGSAHSATLVLKNLNNIPGVNTTCIYRGNRPFRYARDTEYDGIKKESADIADLITKGSYTNLSLISTNEICSISKALRKANWLVQATGFLPRFPEIIIGSATIAPTWDGITGLAEGVQQAQAFGACVPGTTCINEKVYPDISLGSFVEQIEKRWPILKLAIQNQNLV